MQAQAHQRLELRRRLVRVGNDNATGDEIMSKNPLLAKIAKASASKGGNNLKDGCYKLTILNILLEAKTDGNMFIVEFMVDESRAIPGMYELGGKAVWQCENAKEVVPNAAGTQANYVLNLDKNKSAPGNIKAFVLELMGETEDTATEEDVESTLGELISKAQPARGMRIDDETFRKKIKSGENAGKPFVGHNWSHVKMTSDEVAARRATLDKADAQADAAK
jgi:hypothetical protein